MNTKLSIWKDTRRNDVDKKLIECIPSNKHPICDLAYSVQFMARICNYIHPKPRDLITHPYRNINGGLVKPPLKLGHGRIVTQMAIAWG